MVSRILITGDTHGTYDINKIIKISSRQEIHSDDLLIICGDTAICWDGGAHDTKVRHILRKYWSGKIAFIDGNHDNHKLLNELSVSMWNGGKVHVINEQIVHLMRGEVFSINEKTFLVMGGARSIDRGYGIINNKPWWPEELHSKEDMDNYFESAKKHNFKVDYIITHDCPARFIGELIPIGWSVIDNIVTQNLDEIYESMKFKRWFFGHHHKDVNIIDESRSLRCLFEDIIEIY